MESSLVMCHISLVSFHNMLHSTFWTSDRGLSSCPRPLEWSTYIPTCVYCIKVRCVSLGFGIPQNMHLGHVGVAQQSLPDKINTVLCRRNMSEIYSCFKDQNFATHLYGVFGFGVDLSPNNGRRIYVSGDDSGILLTWITFIGYQNIPGSEIGGIHPVSRPSTHPWNGYCFSLYRLLGPLRKRQWLPSSSIFILLRRDTLS